ncbi:G-type lectin S-receptor-like serine/threonine-protein kinase [Senna tora]|uniref:non-specific serine/threonine protein kinase n=1 Tax=Senna tora TaxID=362788 RepID=A0A834TIF8_9FABA|nr:G-type lectin S-receptor-like serine/threonine-protein kinase [Senna tora]
MAILPLIQLLLFLSPFSSASNVNTITLSQPLEDGATLVSPNGTYELGFFTPGNSPNRYVGIWYKNIPLTTVVWVANRHNPSKPNSSTLTIDTQGNLVLLTHNHTVLWSTNSTQKASAPIVHLLDSGNLVLRDNDDPQNQNFLWQSFDYPSDTLLPGMKLGWDLKRGLNRRLIAWKNWDDPSPGDFTWSFVLTNNPEMVLWKGETEYYRGGPWNGIQFSAAPSLKYDPAFSFKFVSNNEELYYTYSLNNQSVISRLVMNQTSYERQRYTWIGEAKAWRKYSSVPRDYCDSYNLCGSFGSCAMGQSPVCQCLRGFEPKSAQNWIAMDWSEGCVRSGNWSCGEKDKDGFLRFSNLKAPDTKRSWVNGSMTLEECRIKCLGDCNCSAYANSDIRGDGSGCAIWFDELIDVRRIPEAGQDIYIRLATSEIDEEGGNKKVVAVVLATIVPFVFVMLLTFAYIYRRNRRRIRGDQIDLELPFYELATIASATNDFSSDNKLGEGGFGPVYRGILQDGQEIAVKRLSQRSGQGLNEFKNEVILCAKLQHRNLVKVLGCCIQGEEKLLIYEYMPNKSLDFFLFDDRPTMASVVVMLSSECDMPQPKEPSFLMEKVSAFEEQFSSGKQQSSSINEASISLLEAR